MLASHLDLGRLLAGLPHEAHVRAPALRWWAGHQLIPCCLQAPGMLPSVPAAACQAPLSPVPSLPPSSHSSLPARCIHFSFETCLGICHGPTAIKLDQQPLTCCPCAEGLMWPQRALGSSGGAPRLCGSKAFSWLQASPGSYLISPPSSSSPFC